VVPGDQVLGKPKQVAFTAVVQQREALVVVVLNQQPVPLQEPHQLVDVGVGAFYDFFELLDHLVETRTLHQVEHQFALFPEVGSRRPDGQIIEV